MTKLGKLFALLSICLVLPSVALAQGTPASADLAESDALWGGNYVEQLPSCDDEPLCLASLTHGWAADEYYNGVIQNNSSDWIDIRTVTVSLFDKPGEFAAQGDSHTISQEVISPGGHALVGITVSGEYLSEFTTEAQFDYVRLGEVHDGSGIPVRIESAEIRGDAVLGELTNTSEYTFNTVWVWAACFEDDGSLPYLMFALKQNGPYEPGASERYAIELYGHECANFIVTAHGSLY